MTRESVFFQYKTPTTSIILTQETKSICSDKTKINFVVGVHKYILMVIVLNKRVQK